MDRKGGPTARPEAHSGEELHAFISRAKTYVGAKEYAKAEALLKSVVRERDDFADVHEMLGFLALEQGRLLTAERHLERALELNPRYTAAAMNLAITYAERGKYEAARALRARFFANASQMEEPLRDPFARGRIANLHAEVATAYESAGLPLEAVRELERALTLGPGFSDLRARLGTLLRDLGRYEEAATHLRAAVNERPERADARLKLGLTELALGRANEAREEFETVLAHDPGHVRAKMYLRYASEPTEDAR